MNLPAFLQQWWLRRVKTASCRQSHGVFLDLNQQLVPLEMNERADNTGCLALRPPGEVYLSATSVSLLKPVVQV